MTMTWVWIGVAAVAAMSVLLNRSDAWMTGIGIYRIRLLERIRQATPWSMPLLAIAAVLLVCGLMVEYGLARASMETLELGSLAVYLAAILTAVAFIAGVWWDFPLGARTVGMRRTHRLGAVMLLLVCVSVMASLAYQRADQTAADVSGVEPVAAAPQDPFAPEDAADPLPEIVVSDSESIWLVRVITVGVAVMLNVLLFLFGRLAAPILQMAGAIVLTALMVALWLPWRLRGIFSSSVPKGNPFTSVRRFLTDKTPVERSTDGRTVVDVTEPKVAPDGTR